MVTQSHVISIRAQDPEERKSNANIQTSERGRPRVTQEPGAPSPELLKQTRDQGCGSPASLPPTLDFPAPAVPPPHTQSRVLQVLGVCAQGLETSLLLAAAGCVRACVCVCHHLCAVLGWGRLTLHTAFPITPSSYVAYIVTGPDHARLYTHATQSATFLHSQKYALDFLL